MKSNIRGLTRSKIETDISNKFDQVSKINSLEKKFNIIYLEALISKYDFISIFDKYKTFAPLFEIFISTPTNYRININIKNEDIVSIEEVRLFREGIIGHSENDAKNDSQKLIELYYDQLKKNIEKCKEYNYPDTSKRPLIISSPTADGFKESYWTLSVLDIISSYDKVVVLGKPGTGKTTAVRYLTINLVNNLLGKNIDSKISVLSDLLFKNYYFPIYIEFRKLTEWWLIQKISESISIKLILQYINSQNIGSHEFTLCSDVNYIFIFDGIDEISLSSTENIQEAFGKNALNRFVNEIKSSLISSKFLFTSRICEYSEWHLDSFEVTELLDMSDFQALQLIDNISSFLGYSNGKIAEDLISDIRDNGFGNDVVFNPMLLSLLTSVALKNKSEGILPNKKTEILKEGITLLLDRWAIIGEKKPDFFTAFETEGSIKNIIFEQLEEFAYYQNENGSIKVEALLSFFRYQKNANEIIEYLSKRIGLIIDEGGHNFKFAHKSFRSYLAASYIVKQSSNMFDEILTNIEKKLKMSHETTFLAIDILFDREDGLYILNQIIIELLSGNNLESDWCTWFAAKIMCIHECTLYNNFKLKESPYLLVIKKSLLRCMKSRNLPHDKKIECGKMLGLIGDIRAGVSTKDSLPDITWCQINGNNFCFGIDSSDIYKIKNTNWGNVDFSREQTSDLKNRSLYIESFMVSKYPITVEQFMPFLKAKDGYFNNLWYKWSDLSENYYAEIIKNRNLNDDEYCHGFFLPKKYRIRNYPISHISFFDAVAFCKWFSYKTNLSIRLPSEMEYEFISKVNGYSIFEWDDDLTTIKLEDNYIFDKCNCENTKIGHICSVGTFRDSNQLIPIDITGNTWEWTQSYFSETLDLIDQNMIINTTENKKINSYSENIMITVKGGSVYNGINCMRITYRGRDPILAVGKDRHSFRIVKESSKKPSQYDEDIHYKNISNNSIAEGYGPIVKVGDSITILYYIKNQSLNSIIQKQENFTFILGRGVIHQSIEDKIIGHKVACNFRFLLRGYELFGDKGYFDRVKPDDLLEVFVHIKDIFE